MSTQGLDPSTLDRMVASRDVGGRPYARLLEGLRSDPQGIVRFQPEGLVQVDPRDGRRVVYNPRRAARPHDSAPVAAAAGGASPCFVCEGRTTRVVDVAQLGRARTFINANLYPVVFPPEGPPGVELPAVDPLRMGPAGAVAAGAHFVQWNSTEHEVDLHNMPPEDIEVVLSRAAALEHAALHAVDTGMPETDECEEGAHRGYLGYIKNVGSPVGGSVAHGHQQLVHTNVEPRAVADDRGFLGRHGLGLGDYLLAINPPLLSVKDYPGCRLLVPYFLSRPLAACIVGTDPDARHLHTLRMGDRLGLAHALRDLSRALHRLMPAMGRPVAYTLCFHLGVAGWYVEAHPWTQETGGYEQLGLWLCQQTPRECAARYREVIE
ncbi:MAG: hypothetical protein HY722_11025 [Planctomycetes bacterium]|nr:hypothetical protein [Planctomycetota bacterium]